MKKSGPGPDFFRTEKMAMTRMSMRESSIRRPWEGWGARAPRPLRLPIRPLAGLDELLKKKPQK
jgi:hypothetical protein